MKRSYNKGEWSELYAFIKLLKDGRIYAADENAVKIDDLYLPIIKLIREETPGTRYDYVTGDTIKIFANGKEIKAVSTEDLKEQVKKMFPVIFTGTSGNEVKGSFAIPQVDAIMDDLFITKVKASSLEKVDMLMQVHDIHTGYSPEVGFSLKSDVGSAPTLLNPGKNTRIRYKISGLSDQDMDLINAVTKETEKEYMKKRMELLIQKTSGIEYDSVLDPTFEDNLTMIDSWLPHIYGELVLQHYLHMSEKIYDCDKLLDIIIKDNPLKYRRADIYRHKFKKLLSASALGMTPGRVWDGLDAATGGYIIIKKDGSVVCYHLYNRNFFEEYLLNNTRFDRPSASRYDYGYVFALNGEKYIDLNVQVRFKSIEG